jgi:hypothetical protein
MKIYNELEFLGFFEWLSETHNLKDTDMTPECLDELPLNDIHRTVCNSIAFRWFREKYNISNSIDCMSRSSEFYNGYYVHFRGINGNKINQENFIVLNDELPPKGYGVYKTYEEAENTCLDKLIELVKNK